MKTPRAKNQKLYFESVDATFCQPLEYFISEAKVEGVDKVTLIEAIPDPDNPDYIWCTDYGEVVERCNCKKRECSCYESKSGRGVCVSRGRLYQHGAEVTFDLTESEVKNDVE